MPKTLLTAAALLALLALTHPPAQKTVPVHAGTGGSPHIRSTWTIHEATISIEYGRPFLKGRPLTALAPAGRVWRTGADEATLLTMDEPVTFGGLTVPAGRYSLYTVPADQEWQLIVNRQTGQWGTVYDAQHDLGRVPMNVRRTPATVEQLTISLDETASGGILRIEWGDVSAAAAFAVVEATPA